MGEAVRHNLGFARTDRGRGTRPARALGALDAHEAQLHLVEALRQQRIGIALGLQQVLSVQLRGGLGVRAARLVVDGEHRAARFGAVRAQKVDLALHERIVQRHDEGHLGAAQLPSMGFRAGGAAEPARAGIGKPAALRRREREGIGDRREPRFVGDGARLYGELRGAVERAAERRGLVSVGFQVRLLPFVPERRRQRTDDGVDRGRRTDTRLRGGPRRFVESWCV